MFNVKFLLILIPLLPLAAAVVTAALGRRVLREWSHLPTVVAIGLSFVASLMLVFQLQSAIERGSGQPGAADQIVSLWRWADISLPSPSGREAEAPSGREAGGEGKSLPSPFGRGAGGEGGAAVDITLRADPLTAVMLAIVTCISTLVAIYSIGYMHGDPGYWRFFSYVALFVFAMTMLVSASNFLLLYMCWELVGLCSYLLIGFWYEKPAAAAAGKKAFLVNRIGDCGFLLAIFLLWTTFGTLDYTKTFAAAAHSPDGWKMTAICLLLLLAACGKSAQFPLHVWLPDAMEGPTPVSALIHAATMVTAGVYMLVRCAPLFATSVDVQTAVAVVGGITALLGAVIALTQTDLKRILAYSTISHLGYMFLAVGTGTLAGATAGMFHLVTHAFFKALLFLCAGSVMHATGGVIDIRRLGGLRKKMPVTHWTFLIGCLAIAGFWPLAGFWSKDAILAAVCERAAASDGEIYKTLFATALFGVLLIDFYMFRPLFLVFYGKEKPLKIGGGQVRVFGRNSVDEAESLGRKTDQTPTLVDPVHESPGVMTVPLMILAFGSCVVGAYFELTHGFANFLAATPSLAFIRESPKFEPDGIAVTSMAITIFGIAAAAVVFLGSPKKAERLARLMNVFGLYSMSFGKFFFDQIYTLLVVWPLLALARLAAVIDIFVIDGLVDAIGKTPKIIGAALRPAQNGMVQFYALAMMLGVLVLIGLMLL